jgi:hypothetical protein
MAMGQIKIYKHILKTNSFNIKKKIDDFRKVHNKKNKTRK